MLDRHEGRCTLRKDRSNRAVYRIASKHVNGLEIARMAREQHLRTIWEPADQRKELILGVTEMEGPRALPQHVDHMGIGDVHRSAGALSPDRADILLALEIVGQRQLWHGTTVDFNREQSIPVRRPRVEEVLPQ